MRRAICALVAALVLASCGYRAGFALRDGGSVGVAMFGNDSKERDLEAELHEQLTDAAQRMIESPLVAPSRCDYLVTGRITDYRGRRGIRNADNVRLESGVRISIVAQLVRGRGRPGAATEPEDVLREVTLSEERGFLFQDPGGEAQARALVLRTLAERAVIDLFADIAWSAPPERQP
jgi:hypothetical protein